MNDTPKGNRIHIAILGRRNAGKSSLINALTGQDMAIVSDTPGTTTDPVAKAMELHPIGPVVFIDTAGFDDEGELGQLRKERTSQTMDKVDIALLMIDGELLDGALGGGETSSGGSLNEELGDVEETLAEEKRWKRMLKDRKIPTVVVINKQDLIPEDHMNRTVEFVNERIGEAVAVSAATGEGIEELRNALTEAARSISDDEDMLVADVSEGSLVLLVMPQDIQAPKGRLILPQVQTIRGLLDRKCSVVSTTADSFTRTLGELSRSPDLIITDSQCFRQVHNEKPDETPLTSFSILMAKAKGDIDVFLDGAKATDELGSNCPEMKTDRTDQMTAGSDQVKRIPKILIVEACTHVPQNEDIGTVKIPRILKKRFGEEVEITNVRGNDFPEIDDLKEYDLIIHCGACMFNRRHVMSRIDAAQKAGVPITNYGVFLAKMNGILDTLE